jgi:titin
VGVFVDEADGTVIGGEPSGRRNVISGNREAGVRLSFDSGTFIKGNFIGTTAAGTAALPNGVGVEIRGLGSFANTLIGGTASEAGNVISGNSGFGIAVFGSSGITVQGNRIGTDVNGISAVPNGQSGVLIERGEFNLIGGEQPGGANLISGNGQSGVTIFDSYANMVQGNLIGTDILGTAPVGNAFAGVHVHSSGEFDSRTLIGGKSGGSGNLISGDDIGVLIEDALYNSVEGNRIGTDISGSQALGNRMGIVLASPYNTIGGTEPGARNVISGNAQQGVSMQAVLGNASSNVLEGNYIGTDASGSATVANEIGVAIGGDGAQRNVIGGLEAGARNVISGNLSAGVTIENGAMVNSVLGNYIGTDAAGSNALPNQHQGVFINEAAINIIGGTEPGAGNLISGNSTGIELFGNGTSGNAVQGNYIGTDASGSAGVGNVLGVVIGGATENLIGGSTPTARNVISGNSHGIEIVGPNASGNQVKGNYVGTDATGKLALGNGFHGVLLDGADNNLIGGTGAGDGNVISYSQWGVRISEATGNVVAGNYVGTNASGTVALGNLYGIEISGIFPGSNVIGGGDPGAGNLIAGAEEGIRLIQGATKNVIHGNYVGTNRDGASLGNEVGISIEGLSQNIIGGSLAGEGNVIAFSASHGVVDRPLFPFLPGSTIRGNSIHANGGKGIESMVFPELPPPVVAAAGSASGTACAQCTIDVYSDSEDEGRVYHGSTVADGAGSWSYTAGVVGPHVTATATDANGSTSEFSAPFACADDDGDGICNSGDTTPLGVCGGLPVTIRGSEGPDVIAGTAGADVIQGGGGDDLIRGGDGNDVICGGAGDDILSGGKGADLLDGGADSDRCHGGQGRDTALRCERVASAIR